MGKKLDAWYGCADCLYQPKEYKDGEWRIGFSVYKSGSCPNCSKPMKINYSEVIVESTRKTRKKKK